MAKWTADLVYPVHVPEVQTEDAGELEVTFCGHCVHVQSHTIHVSAGQQI